MPELAIMDFSFGFIADHLSQAPERLPGYHLTDLIRASKFISRNKAVPPREEPDEMVLGLMNMGRFWEEASRSAFKARVEQVGLNSSGPHQLSCDGVICNVDGLVWSDVPSPIPYINNLRPVAVQESKFRFAQPSDPRDNIDWMAQCKGYCYIFGVRSVWMPIANLTTRPPSACSQIYMLEFTEQEIRENWQMITKTRDYLEIGGMKKS